MSDTTIQYVPQTPRAFLASLTPPLAVNHEGARGRFSKEGVAALDKARALGFRFIGDEGHPDTPVKGTKGPRVAVKGTEKPAASEPTPAVADVPTQTTGAETASVNAKDVRAWATQNGHTVGARGRIRPEVIAAFLKAKGQPTGQAAKPVKTEPKQVRVRSQQVAWGRIPRRKSDPKYLTEPILGINQCGTCHKGVAYCPCEGGPTLPKHYGAGPTVLRLSDLPPAAQAVTEVTA